MTPWMEKHGPSMKPTDVEARRFIHEECTPTERWECQHSIDGVPTLHRWGVMLKSIDGAPLMQVLAFNDDTNVKAIISEIQSEGTEVVFDQTEDGVSIRNSLQSLEQDSIHPGLNSLENVKSCSNSFSVLSTPAIEFQRHLRSLVGRIVLTLLPE
ncbi:hypothetical protein LWI29_024728 [Acer saccharum]|uniref:Uncharacterized protein n=1 Tax=Acer saccharum TaxID=4024 RepID=A0AA39RNA3_ACESA|nr:hypothetical protein LWI29_024728 [Acer saccharum]